MANDKRITDLSLIWDSLGSFWGQFPDKDLFTKFWTEYREVCSELYRRKAQVHISKYLSTLKPVLDYYDVSYEMVFNGDDRNTVTSSGLHAYEIPKHVYSIPTLSGVETDQLLTENTEYEIHDKQFIRFLTNPTFDPGNVDIENRVTLYAGTVYRHNPILWNIHASGIGLTVSSLDNEEYLPYNIIADSGNDRVIDIADHYKYLIWGLAEMRRRPPTITDLETGYGISRGLPFAYRAGTAKNVTSSGLQILVSGLTNTYDTYIINSGFNILPVEDEFVPQFDLLISGIRLHDQINNRTYVDSLSGTNTFNYTSRVVFTYNSALDSLNYSTEFHASYLASLMPVGLNYQSLAE